MNTQNSMRLHLAYGDTKQHLKTNCLSEPRDLFSFMEKKQRQAFLQNAAEASKRQPCSTEQTYAENDTHTDDEYCFSLVTALKALRGKL